MSHHKHNDPGDAESVYQEFTDDADPSWSAWLQVMHRRGDACAVWHVDEDDGARHENGTVRGPDFGECLRRARERIGVPL